MIPAAMLPYLIRFGAVVAIIAGLWITLLVHDHRVVSAERERAQATLNKAILVADADAQVKANAATLALQKTEVTINQLKKDKANALAKLTHGTVCFDHSTVGMLNNPNSAALPTDTAKPVRDDAAGLAASDTDVAGWVIEASSLYAICSARLNALIGYVK